MSRKKPPETPVEVGTARKTSTSPGPRTLISTSSTACRAKPIKADVTKVAHKAPSKPKQNEQKQSRTIEVGVRKVSNGGTTQCMPVHCRARRTSHQGRQKNENKELKPVVVKVARKPTSKVSAVPRENIHVNEKSDLGLPVESNGREGEMHKGHGLLKGGWFYKLSRPVIAGLKKKVSEKFHRNGDETDDVTASSRPARPEYSPMVPSAPGHLEQTDVLTSSKSGPVTQSGDVNQNDCQSFAVNNDDVDVPPNVSEQLQKDNLVTRRKPWKPDNKDNVRHCLKNDCRALFLVVDLPREISRQPSSSSSESKLADNGRVPEVLGFEPETLLKQKLLETSSMGKAFTDGGEIAYDGNAGRTGFVLRKSCSNSTQGGISWIPEDRQSANCRRHKQRTSEQPSSRDDHVNETISHHALQAETAETCPGEPDETKEWKRVELNNGTLPSTHENIIDHIKTDSDTEEDADENTPDNNPSLSLLKIPPSPLRRKSSTSLHTMIPLYQGRLSLLQAEKDVLLDMNSSLRDENNTLRRMTRMLTGRESLNLDVEQTTATNGVARPSEVSLLPRLSHGRLPSLATLTRINLRFNREHHGCLHRAVLGGKEEDVESFLSAGKDINAHDEYGKTPLHCAVGAQKLNIVQCLLSHRPDIDAHDDRDDTPLHTAVRTGNIDVVTALLKDGHADSNSVGNGGCSPLHVAAQLEHVNNVAICKLLLDNSAKLLTRDHKWMTPLAHSALHGSFDVLVCLFHYASGQGIPKDDLLFEVDGVGSTLLHLAVESGSARVVELCLDEGAAPNSVKSQDGSTPVHLACSNGYMDILDILMKAVAFILDPPPDQDGMLPIHRAAQSNHHEVIAYLLKQDVDQIDAVDHVGRTPIMLAAENGCFGSVRVLLDHGANADIRDSDNKTVLHYAIGGVEILKEILKDVKANSLIRAKDRHGNTPLHYASRHGCTKDVAIILMKYKASAAFTNGMGEIPLHIAARYGWLAVVTKLTDGRGKRTMNANDANERTPLHLAAREGHDELVEFFLKRGARIDRDVHGQTPLHYAALQGSKKSLELILENKPDCLNVTDKNQNTSLHMAAMGGHAEILKFLLNKPDQVVTVNERNQNPLDIAIEAKHEAVAMAIAENKRWKEVVRSTVHGTYTQIQLLVRHMPEVAKTFLDRCVLTEGDPENEDYKVSYDLKFIQGMTDENKKTKNIRESLIALHTMVKYERLECLTHPLCSVLMDIKWRKFGLVCAFLNQGVYLIYISLIMVIMNYIVTFTKESIGRLPNSNNSNNSTPATTATPTVAEDPLLIKAFQDDSLIATVAVILIVACVYNLSKEFFQMFDEGWKYFFSINNWLEVTLYVMTFVTIVRPRTNDLAGLAVCVFLSWIVLLHYISKFNYVGLYVVMIRKTVMTVCKVLIVLVIFLAAFAFSFHVITVPLTDVPVAHTRFNDISASLAATFFMILDNLKYDEIVLQYTGSSGSGVVLYGLFIAYCIMMPIIFLNLLIGLAVGDIDNIRKTAAMERYTSQVEHLSQLERALPTFILSKVQVSEYVEHPNRQKNFKDKVVNLLVMLLSPRQEQDKKLEDQTYMEERVQRHEAQLKEISSVLRKHSVLLEEMRDLLLDKKKRLTGTREGEETESVNSPDSTEFFV